jgi:hypothetical protein
MALAGLAAPVAGFAMIDSTTDRMWFRKDRGTGALWTAGHFGPIRRGIQFVGGLFDPVWKLIEKPAGSDPVRIPFRRHHQLVPMPATRTVTIVGFASLPV